MITLILIIKRFRCLTKVLFRTKLRASMDSNADFQYRFDEVSKLIRRPLDGPKEVTSTAHAGRFRANVFLVMRDI